MDIIVCGGRDFEDRSLVFETLDGLDDVRSVVQGGAHGADALAREWAEARRVVLTTFFADWSTYGKKAGPIRNQRMLDEARPHLLVAFPGGAGTTDMVRRAMAAAVKVMQVARSPERQPA